MNDGKIIELFFERSDEAITELSEKYGRLAISLARNILGDEGDAEECVNDAYLAAWNNIPPEQPLALGAYLCGIVRNHAVFRCNFPNNEFTCIVNIVAEMENIKVFFRDIAEFGKFLKIDN